MINKKIVTFLNQMHKFVRLFTITLLNCSIINEKLYFVLHIVINYCLYIIIWYITRKKLTYF